MYLSVPAWVKRHDIFCSSVDDVPEEVFERIRNNFKQIYSGPALVSVVLIAFNEEKTILKSLSSVSELQSKYPFEVIVVNNNSSDRTQEILDRCGVKSIFQPLQGVGFARDAGMQIAKGKYHLCADADSIYPPNWINEMIAPLEQGKAICTYGKVSFLPDGNKSRLSLALYEFFRGFSAGFKAINRPEMNANGASLAFFTRMGKKIGWCTEIEQGEDSSMVFAMKRYGYVRMVSSNDSRIWTTARTLDRDGHLIRIIWKRARREFSRIHFYLTSSRQNA